MTFPQNNAARLREWCIARISDDQRGGFPFLSRVPSADARMFTEYYRQADDHQFTNYIASIPNPDFWDQLNSLSKNPSFEVYKKTAARWWRNRPTSVKRTMGLLLSKTKQLPTHMILPGDTVTEEEILKCATSSPLTKKQILAALRSQFLVKCKESDGDGGQYIISSKVSVLTCQTIVIIALGGSVIGYYHLLIDTLGTESHPFMLVGHSIDWRISNWDLADQDNIDECIRLLREIVSEFESLF